jgi:hypothetical protein
VTKTARLIYDHDERGDLTDKLLAVEIPADPEMAAYVMNAPEDDDGRSGWLWFQLPNGDWILGVWPRGETYFATELDREYDFEEDVTDPHAMDAEGYSPPVPPTEDTKPLVDQALGRQQRRR